MWGRAGFARILSDKVCVWGVAICLVTSGAVGKGQAHAQEPPDQATEGQVRTGTLELTPGFWMTGGYTDNLSNESETTGLGKGYELVVVPQLEGSVQLRRVMVDGAAAVEILRYAGIEDYTPPQANRHARFAATLDEAARVRPHVAYSYRNHWARPTGFEVGAKSQRVEHEWLGGVDVRAGGRTTLGASANYVSLAYDAAAQYQGSSLQEFLNRDVGLVRATFGYELTPLTTLSGFAEASRERFTYSPERDADLSGAGVALRMATPAVLSGFVAAGVRRFTPKSGVPSSFNGFAAHARVDYMQGGLPRLGVAYDRDTAFSWDVSRAYSVTTSLALEIGQPLTQTSRLTFSVERARLDYTVSETAAGAGRIDHFTMYALGIAKRLRPRFNIGIDGEYASKDGIDPWTSTRVVAFVTYGAKRLLRLDRPLPGVQK